MVQPKILTLVGGISQRSLNQKIFYAFRDIVGAEAELCDFDIKKLPYFSQDIELTPPQIVSDFQQQIILSQAVLLITPEYNRSLPGVLKNAIDWGSRPYGKNLWEKMPAAILGASIGNIGTFGAQHHLRQILSYLNLFTMNQPELYLNASHAFNEEGRLVDNKIHHLLLNFWVNFKLWVDKYARVNYEVELPRILPAPLSEGPGKLSPH
jgi:NAD(P)H-dependent FMN reductase